MGRAIRILIALCVLAAPAAAVAVGKSGHVYVSDCTKVRYKPKTITLSCGDGSSSLTGLKWSNWTATQATGKGTENVNSCKPACVSGKVKHSAATVKLSKPAHCNGVKHKVFKRAQITPAGQKATSLKLGCPIGGAFY